MTLCPSCKRPLEPVVDVYPEAVLKAAAELWHVTLGDLRGPRRLPRLVRARQIAMFVAHELGASYPEIGEAFDRHHATVMYGVTRVRDRLDDPRVADRVRRLREAVG